MSKLLNRANLQMNKSLSTANFAPERYGPDRMLLEALIKDSEEDWMKILRERRNEIIGWPVCVLICVVKRWTATLSMLADLQEPLFTHFLCQENSILYQYIRDDALVAKAELKWPKLSHSVIALILASRDGYIEGVRALMELVVLPKPTYWHGGSILLEAVASRNIETVRALFDGGQRDYFMNGCGAGAAARAAQLGNLEIMQEFGWSANDIIVLERGVYGGNMDVVRAIVAARTEKFDLERISRFTKDESIRKLLSEANAGLPEKVLASKASHWSWFSAKPKQPKAASKKEVD